MTYVVLGETHADLGLFRPKNWRVARRRAPPRRRRARPSNVEPHMRSDGHLSPSLTLPSTPAHVGDGFIYGLAAPSGAGLGQPARPG